ncbi:transposase [Micromonospora sp. NPDC047738]|uniref:transposase n=1 Tax=Micromonospora sp. NPDC047738 TaxID=3155741 RepID=UPI0033ECF01C
MVIDTILGWAEGRDPQPSAAVLDSQTAHSHQGGEAIGYAGKRTRGRKRHVLVDTCGLLLKAVVHSASIQERASRPRLTAEPSADRYKHGPS